MLLKIPRANDNIIFLPALTAVNLVPRPRWSKLTALQKEVQTTKLPHFD